MDEPFDEWVKGSTQHTCVQRWAEELIELGTSWASFRRDPDEIVKDLVTGNIPLLAARDIVNIASETINRSNAPMAIFWDLENMPIPLNSSGRHVTSRLKSILAPHGKLVQFRGYASIGLGLIPQQKRSDLQLSGCHLVDCPHNGRKEVADKMIIVDAMQFAFTHPEGATLCFITGDVDYAYLLAVLQQPQWRTIVISKGTLQSMLHVNCDMKMRWETDILQLRPPPGFDELVSAESMLINAKHMEQNISSCSVGTGTSVTPSNPMDTNDNSSMLSEQQPIFEPLTPDEEWTDDVELLRTLLRTLGCSLNSSLTFSTLKSRVCERLREVNPARFSSREIVRSFIARSIEMGVVIESDEGGVRMLSLPTNITQSVQPAISLSDQVPMKLQDVPERVIELSGSRPYILFASWHLFPQGTKIPKRAFVQSSGKWAILLFKTLTDAQRTVAEELPQLRLGTLVDWRRAGQGKIIKVTAEVSKMPVSTLNDWMIAPKEDQPATKFVNCKHCNSTKIESDMIPSQSPLSDNQFVYYCLECYQWEGEDSKRDAIQKVVSMLEFMAENDDIYIAENILRKQLCARYPQECTSRKHGSLWIAEAIKAEKVLPFKREGLKGKLVCLPSMLKIAQAPFPPDEVNTCKEEKFVLDLLWDNNGWMSRTDVISRLKTEFETMQSPFLRNKVFLNAHGKGSFFIGKGCSSQTVGLSKEDADMAMTFLETAVENGSTPEMSSGAKLGNS